MDYGYLKYELDLSNPEKSERAKRKIRTKTLKKKILYLIYELDSLLIDIPAARTNILFQTEYVNISNKIRNLKANLFKYYSTLDDFISVLKTIEEDFPEIEKEFYKFKEKVFAYEGEIILNKLRKGE